MTVGPLNGSTENPTSGWVDNYVVTKIFVVKTIFHIFYNFLIEILSSNNKLFKNRFFHAFGYTA